MSQDVVSNRKIIGTEGWVDMGEYGSHHLGDNPDFVAVDPGNHVIILVGLIKREYVDFLKGSTPSGPSFMNFCKQRAKSVPQNIDIESQCVRDDVQFKFY